MDENRLTVSLAQEWALVLNWVIEVDSEKELDGENRVVGAGLSWGEFLSPPALSFGCSAWLSTANRGHLYRSPAATGNMLRTVTSSPCTPFSVGEIAPYASNDCLSWLTESAVGTVSIVLITCSSQLAVFVRWRLSLLRFLTSKYPCPRWFFFSRQSCFEGPNKPCLKNVRVRMFSIGVMCYRETVLTGKNILFLGNLNLSFWAGFFQKTIGCPCRRKRKAGFFLLRLGVNSARVLDSLLHCCCIICTHSVSLFFPSLARLDLQMFRVSAHPKSSQASSLRSLIPVEKMVTSSHFECGFHTN